MIYFGCFGNDFNASIGKPPPADLITSRSPQNVVAKSRHWCASSLCSSSVKIPVDPTGGKTLSFKNFWPNENKTASNFQSVRKTLRLQIRQLHRGDFRFLNSRQLASFFQLCLRLENIAGKSAPTIRTTLCTTTTCI